MKHTRTPKFQLYRARDGWRWRLIARNGKIVAESGEAYVRKPNTWALSIFLNGTMRAAWIETLDKRPRKVHK